MLSAEGLAPVERLPASARVFGPAMERAETHACAWEPAEPSAIRLPGLAWERAAAVLSASMMTAQWKLNVRMLMASHPSVEELPFGAPGSNTAEV